MFVYTTWNEAHGLRWIPAALTQRGGYTNNSVEKAVQLLADFLPKVPPHVAEHYRHRKGGWPKAYGRSTVKRWISDSYKPLLWLLAEAMECQSPQQALKLLGQWLDDGLNPAAEDIEPRAAYVAVFAKLCMLYDEYVLTLANAKASCYDGIALQVS
jgi:hypothetical protein